MESQKGDSQPRDLNQSRLSSPSALRALTASPRRSLMRPRRDSYSSSSTGTSSATSSTDLNIATSCVVRQTFTRDDCALHRFIVWAAVQRNACEKMSPSEKLECPMLRCRKRFSNHEMMLRHLYTCELLSTGEYWCYECGKPEKFTDGNCKKCLGHPGKRRKIMDMAKNFFSSLGQHKSRKDTALALDYDNVTLSSRHSMDTWDKHPQEVELPSANEILEIDSVEVPPSPPPVPRSDPGFPSIPQTFQASFLEQPTALNPSHLVSVPALPVPLPIIPATTDTLLGWEHETDQAVRDAFSIDLEPVRSMGRPILQVNTRNLEQYHANYVQQQQELQQQERERQQQQQRLQQQQQQSQNPKSRTKNLSPSASLRSNASTNTTASNGISPISTFSGVWTLASGWDTALTSPASDLASLSRGNSNASRRSCWDEVQIHETISELPADFTFQDSEIQQIPDMSDTELLPDTHNSSSALDSLPLINIDEVTSLQPDKSEKANEQREWHIPPLNQPSSLVQTAWKTLREHIDSSIQKMRHLSHNPLAEQLQHLQIQEITSIGLSTLQHILDGQTPTSSLDLLCFIHLTYSLSLVVYEHDAHDQSRDLFIHAYGYSDLAPQDERRSFVDVVTAIWQPQGLPSTELDELLVRHYSQTASASGLIDTDESSSMMIKRFRSDHLVGAAQFFLDELEYATQAICQHDSIAVLTSDLWTRHLEDTQAQWQPHENFSAALRTIIVKLEQKLQIPTQLVLRLKKIQARAAAGDIRTMRKAELELIQAGKAWFSSTDYFNVYVTKVREACDESYAARGFVCNSRTLYQKQAIALMMGLSSEVDARVSSDERLAKSKDRSLDDFFTEMTAFDEEVMDVLPDMSQLNVPDFSDILNSPFIDLTASSTALASGECDQQCSSSQASGLVDQETPFQKAQSHECCDICGFRPKGDPKWFRGSMAKHKKHQHSKEPTVWYKCPFPGCKSEYRNRPDNLRQHQLDKGHFIDKDGSGRPKKRRKISQEGST